MAKVNPVKLRQEADAAERANRLDKAVEALKQVVADNPRDWNTVNRIGDLYAKLNNPKAANEQYVKVARYFSDDGFYLKAIAVWKKVLRNEPAMLDGHVALGELYQKQGLVAEARQTFGYVYDEYVKRNKLRDAGEVLRRMAEVDPGDLKVRIRLAELYAREGDPDRAAGEYVTIAEELVKKGLLAEALQLLDKALRGGQRRPRLLAAAARVHLAQKDYTRAADLLREALKVAPDDRELALRLAEASLGARRADEARAVLQSLLERDGNDDDARQQLVQVYLAEGRFDEAHAEALPAVDRLVQKRQVERAASLLQQIVQRKSTHVATLAKLVELYRLTKNDALVAQTYQQMVDAYIAAGDMEQAAAVVELLIQLEPANEQHRSKLRWLREQQNVPSSGFEVDLEASAAPAAPRTAPAAPVSSSAPPAAIELTGPLSSDDQEFVSEHLAEGRVFRKYGLTEKARDQFEAVLSRFPDNTEALQELVELHRDKGEMETAAQRLRTLAQVHRLKGDRDAAARAEAEAGSALSEPQRVEAAPVARPAPAAEARAVAAPARIPAAPAPVAAPAPAAHLAPDLGVQIDVEEVESPAPGGGAPPPPPEPELDFDLGSLTVEPEPKVGAFEEGDISPVGEIGGHFIDDEEAAVPQAPSPQEPPAAARPAQFRPVAEAAPLPAPLVAQPTIVGRSPVGKVPVELGRALEEAESYVSMGFVEDARRVLAEVAPRFAAHPALQRRAVEMGLELGTGGKAESGFALVQAGEAAPAAPDEPLQLEPGFLFGEEPAAPPPAPRPAPAHRPAAPAPRPSAARPQPAPPLVAPAPAEAGGFDLSAELGDLFGAQPALAPEEAAGGGTAFEDTSLADIFREFQKGVEKQLGKEDYETRYNLGIAYKEMGLVDEAIAEFQLAAKDESRLLECSSMLGICFLEKGMPKLAVKWFEKGLQAPGRREEEYQGLRYDLANALEQDGDTERALALYTELYGQNAKFRDVAEKVRSLG
ncbi:MAG TPA: tetratricopeptide repeat protein, partial [Vicinamibacteria bacterium]|nr:tetratricopeptide repeat protein [Vicinamibacteria bacterium]